MKIAIVGAGIAGIAAAYILDKKHDITLFERNSYLGGHTNTIVLKTGAGGSVAVDTGFIVCNPLTYPNFYRFLDELEVARRDSEMSFGFSCELTGLHYIGPNLKDFARLPLNFFKTSFLRILKDLRLFSKRALADLNSSTLDDLSLGQYLKELAVSASFINNFVIPLGSAIWSSPDSNMLNFPAKTFITFFRNHGVLELSKQPVWQTVVGGSHSYIKAFSKKFRGKIFLKSEIKTVQRSESKEIRLKLENGENLVFDKIIMATHADEALQLLQNPTSEEERLLGSWRYHSNKTVLHTDSSLMPRQKRVWASWNYRRTKHYHAEEPISITYYMNRLQGLSGPEDYFVTLNAKEQIKHESIIYKTVYTHPEYSAAAVASQKGLAELNGANNTFFCGSYMRYGFHEDALWSALQAAEKLGVPW